MTRPISLKPNLDHFGFYQVGPYKTYSKLDALEISAKTGIDLKWNFNDEVYSKFDWKTEPPGTLDFWYAERARQIREKYDYIVLWYSGGADSWNILQAFVDNNIYIDEIAHYIVHDNTSVSLDQPFNEEVVKTSYPTVKKLIESNPLYKTTKHRVVDGGPKLIEKISSVNPYDYFYQEGNYFFGAWGTTLADIQHTDDYQKLINKEESVCFLWGYDKPWMQVTKEGKFQIRFSELSSAMYARPKDSWDKTKGKFDEAFYWTPDMPEITCKQAHVIKRYVDSLSLANVDNFYLKRVNQPSTHSTFCLNFYKDDQLFELTNHGLHRLIYKGWDVNSIVCNKPSSPLLSDKDRWWFSDTSDSRSSWYLKGVIHLRDHIKKIQPNWWVESGDYRNNPSTFKASIKLCRNLYDIN